MVSLNLKTHIFIYRFMSKFLATISIKIYNLNKRYIVIYSKYSK